MTTSQLKESEPDGDVDMKCPNCNYELKFSPDNDEYALGEGRFFELGIKAEQRTNELWADEEREPS